ncbi:hypothetical protein F1559_002143 [Cyanidiococcus yangmingshanensis]|uniref:Uncharacterized protein n=1 Tax=Cyanidiococcus yangmingshanensis TaxID=2690220 RepID=A0A7J7IDB2_9RHOD|nr:hypothetical protein F1559_002143 [Cyanidiococcus yangmingshanensis]
MNPTKDELLRSIHQVEEALQRVEVELETRLSVLAKERAKAPKQSRKPVCSAGQRQGADTKDAWVTVESSELAAAIEQVMRGSREKAAFAHALVHQHWTGGANTSRTLQTNEFSTSLPLWYNVSRFRKDHDGQVRDVPDETSISDRVRKETTETQGLGNAAHRLDAQPSSSLAPLLDKPAVISIFHDLYRWHRRYGRALRNQYDKLYAEWRQRLRQVEAQRHEREVERARDRDRYLFLAARGLDTTALAQQRTTVLADLDTYLFEIEMDGGTAGGQSRWERNLAVIPDQEWLPCSTARFDGGSARLVDPAAAYRASQVINPWTAWEQRVFIEKFLVYYKDFHAIASFLEFKTTADCVLFYFQNKLRLELREAFRTYQRLRRANIPVQLSFTTDSVPYLVWSDHTTPLLASLVPAGTSVTSVMGQRPLAVAASSGVVGVLSAFERPWSEDELGLFLRALTQFGSNFRAIASYLGTRTARECADLFRMNRRRMGLDRFLPLKELESKAIGRTTNETAIARNDAKVDDHEGVSGPTRRPAGARPSAVDPVASRGAPGSGPSRGSSFAVWTPEEEIQFAEAFSDIGADWRRLAELIPSKTPEQIYTYWQQQALSAVRQSRRGRSGS